MDYIYLRISMLLLGIASIFYSKFFLSKSCREEIIYFKKKYMLPKRFFIFIFFNFNFIFLLIFFNPLFAFSTLYVSISWFLFPKLKNKFFYFFLSFYLLFLLLFPQQSLYYVFVFIILFNLSFFSLFP